MKRLWMVLAKRQAETRVVPERSKVKVLEVVL
jgi:hypothetical protein